MSVGYQLVIFPCNDTIVDIWSSNILGNDRNKADARRPSTYYLAELYNLMFPCSLATGPR